MIISIAIPCYNSSKTLRQVVNEIKSVIQTRENTDYQIILVNDTSPDNTFEVITQLCSEDSKIIGVDLSKNYGQASAQMAAVRYIKGDVAVFMDDDGQHPPAELFKLVDKISDGYDVVYAQFISKKHSLFKRVSSNINSKILEFTNRKPKGIQLSSYFALSKFAVRALKNYKSPFPSLGGYLLQVTRRITNVQVEHRARICGRSNYSFKKLLKLWLQGFTNFSIAPLRFASHCWFVVRCGRHYCRDCSGYKKADFPQHCSRVYLHCFSPPVYRRAYYAYAGHTWGIPWENLHIVEQYAAV